MSPDTAGPRPHGSAATPTAAATPAAATHAPPPSRHTRGWPDAAIAELAARQATIITHAQLRALGVSASAIKRATARRRLHRVHRGVYSLVAPAARPPLAAAHAAILAVGPKGVLSHGTAARLLGIDTEAPAEPVHVTVAGGHRHSRPGLVVHRAARLDPADHHRLHGLAVTSVARTAIDLAPTRGPAALAALVDRALRQASRTKFREALARHEGRPATARIRTLLDPARPSADTWSRAEQRLLDLIRRAGLPLPEANVTLGRYVPDLLWREQHVIAEYDSDAYHSGPAAQRWDAARHNHFTSLGYAVLHVTARELSHHPERVLVQIATALALSAHRRA